MKNIIISFSIFAVMLISIFFALNYLNKTCQNLEELSDQIETHIDKGDWDTAYKESIVYLDKWQKYTDILSIFVNHQEIDNVNNELWKLSQYIKENNKDETMASVHVIKFYLKHINGLEKVNPQNIL